MEKKKKFRKQEEAYEKEERYLLDGICKNDVYWQIKNLLALSLSVSVTFHLRLCLLSLPLLLTAASERNVCRSKAQQPPPPPPPLPPPPPPPQNQLLLGAYGNEHCIQFV